MFYRAPPRYKNTYGAILVEGGKEDAGIQWLKLNFNLDFPTNCTLSSSMYLALAYHRLGNKKEFELHHNYVYNNQQLLDADDLMLWKRIEERLKV
jgi:hypothetical protein